MDSDEIARFRRFLQFPTVSRDGPSGVYAECVEWLRSHFDGIAEFEVSVFAPVKNKPVLHVKWQGEQPELPSLLLNSHYDVVPVQREHWTKEPFAADIVDNKVYARGAQDMKCVCMQHLESVLRLQRRHGRLRRTVHLTFVPDEEVGGHDGIGKMLEDGFFDGLNLGLALDEGLANETAQCTVFNGERTCWWARLRATGATGHGSRFIEPLATDRLLKTLQNFLDLRAREKKRLEAQCDENSCGCAHTRALKLGDVTTINLTRLSTGENFAHNVVPNVAEAALDIRIATDVDLQEFEAQVNEWCAENEVSIEFAQKADVHAETDLLEKRVEPWWQLFQKACAETGVSLSVETFPAGTDSRMLRRAGYPALGFSPMSNTPILLHDHDEFIGIDTFLDGIGVFEHLVHTLASAPAHAHELSA